MMSRLVLLLLGASRAALGKEWVSKAGEALAAAKPRSAPEAATKPNWLDGRRRKLDQTVDYDNDPRPRPRRLLTALSLSLL